MNIEHEILNEIAREGGGRIIARKCLHNNDMVLDNQGQIFVFHGARLERYAGICGFSVDLADPRATCARIARMILNCDSGRNCGDCKL